MASVMDNNPYYKIDSKLLQKLMRSPEFVATVPSTSLEQMQTRIQQANWTPSERLIYKAMQEGYTDFDSIQVATGLDSGTVSKSLGKLQDKGVNLSLSLYGEGKSITS